MNRLDVYEIIDGERDYQEILKNKNGWNSTHSLGEFLVLLDVYINKAKSTWCLENDKDAKKTKDIIRKIAALSVACMEENGSQARKK